MSTCDAYAMSLCGAGSFLMLAIVGSMVVGLLRAFMPSIKGSIGEARINSLIRGRLDNDIYRVISDVMLPAGNPKFTGARTAA